MHQILFVYPKVYTSSLCALCAHWGIFCSSLSALPLFYLLIVFALLFISFLFSSSFCFCIFLTFPPTHLTRRKSYFLTRYLSITITITHPFCPRFIVPYIGHTLLPHTQNSKKAHTQQRQPQRGNKDEKTGTSVVPGPATRDPGYDLCVAVEA